MRFNTAASKMEQTFECRNCRSLLGVVEVAEHQCELNGEVPRERREEPPRDRGEVPRTHWYDDPGAYAKAWLWYIVRISAYSWLGGVLFLLAFDVLSAWVVWFLRNVAWPVLAWSVLKEKVLGFLGPPPDPGVWSQAAKAATDTAYVATEAVASSWFGPMVVCGTITAGLCILALVFLRDQVQKIAMHMQGYHCESLQAGSTFVRGVTPKFQVAIEAIGLLTTVHLGYGIRIGSWLAMPQHVRNGRDILALVGPTGKVTCRVSTTVASRVHSDLEYMYLEESVWSKLGVVKATRARALTSVAQCSGQPGTSSGLLKRTSQFGIVKYLGSTLPGMSGAAYVSGGKAVAMHVGNVPGDHNVGIAASVLFEEVALIVGPESGVLGDSAGQAEQSARVAQMLTPKKGWDDREVKLRLKAQYAEEPDLTSGEDWAEHVSNFFEEESAPTISIPLKAVKVKAQGVENDEYYVEYATNKVVGKIEQLERRVQQLEEEVVALRRDSKKPMEKFPCDQCDVQCHSQEKLAKHKLVHETKRIERYMCGKCDVVCKSKIGLDNHMATSHMVQQQTRFRCDSCEVECRSEERLQRHKDFSCPKRVIGESAQAGDFRKTVKQGSFLGRGRASQKKSLRSSSRGSNSSGETLRLQRLEENQRETNEYLKLIAHSLSAQQQGMVGQSLEKTQNSAAS